jgi:anti-sigma B factor antagonist
MRQNPCINKRAIVVVGLPERLTRVHSQTFLLEIHALLNTDRPRIVFDLSQVQEIDGKGTDMLLHCVRQVIRQDGELMLAAVPAEIRVVLELTCIDRLFQIFESNSDAVESYSRLAAWNSSLSINPSGSDGQIEIKQGPPARKEGKHASDEANIVGGHESCAHAVYQASVEFDSYRAARQRLSTAIGRSPT